MQIVRRDPLKGDLDTMLWCPKSTINAEAIKRALTFEIEDRSEVPTVLQLWAETADHLLVPREFWRYSERLFEVIDCRPQRYRHVELVSHIQLDHKKEGNRLVPLNETVQRSALGAMLAAHGGILQLSCGRGKTVIAIEAIVQLHMPAIIIVDNTTLLGQWREELNAWLPGVHVGTVEGGVFDWQQSVVLATYQTLALHAADLPEEFRRYFGTIVWDEGHHIGAPTFAKTADMFYGRRYALTATPHRADGMHIIYDMHIGPVLYKDLTQELRPRIQFRWTGFSIDLNDDAVVRATHSRTGDLHMGMLARYFGNHRPRLQYIVDLVRSLQREGRKTLVLSSSIDELVNLLSLWNNADRLYSDIPLPTVEEVDPDGDPNDLVWKTEQIRPDWIVTTDEKEALDLLMAIHTPSAGERFQLRRYQFLLRVEKMMRRRQKAYLEELLRTSTDSSAGLMIFDVDRDERRRAIKEKSVTFSIMKYGREGLDSRALDTVIVLEPQKQKEWIQQVMGRALRLFSGKREPLIIIFEDDVGVMIGLCNKLRSHLRKWPTDEGGPYRFENVGTRPPRSWT